MSFGRLSVGDMTYMGNMTYGMIYKDYTMKKKQDNLEYEYVVISCSRTPEYDWPQGTYA